MKSSVPKRRRRLWLGALATTIFLLTLAAVPAAVAVMMAGRDLLSLGLAVGQATVFVIAVVVVAEGRWLR